MRVGGIRSILEVIPTKGRQKKRYVLTNDNIDEGDDSPSRRKDKVGKLVTKKRKRALANVTNAIATDDIEEAYTKALLQLEEDRKATTIALAKANKLRLVLLDYSVFVVNLKISTKKNALIASYLNLYYSYQLSIVNKVIGQELTEMLALSKVCFRLYSPK